jgi:hypothetical protein
MNSKMEYIGKKLNLKPHIAGFVEHKRLVGPCDIEGHKGDVRIFSEFSIMCRTGGSMFAILRDGKKFKFFLFNKQVFPRNRPQRELRVVFSFVFCVQSW